MDFETGVDCVSFPHEKYGIRPGYPVCVAGEAVSVMFVTKSAVYAIQ